MTGAAPPRATPTTSAPIATPASASTVPASPGISSSPALASSRCVRVAPRFVSCSSTCSASRRRAAATKAAKARIKAAPSPATSRSRSRATLPRCSRSARTPSGAVVRTSESPRPSRVIVTRNPSRRSARANPCTRFGSRRAMVTTVLPCWSTSGPSAPSNDATRSACLPSSERSGTRPGRSVPRPTMRARTLGPSCTVVPTSDRPVSANASQQPAGRRPARTTTSACASSTTTSRVPSG